MAFADKWDFCDATSFWRILAAYCRALRVAAPGSFAVVQAGQMRLMRVHDEPKLGLNVCPELTLDSPKQQPSRWRAHSRAALPGTASAGSAGPCPLGTLGIIYEGCTACQTPPKAWAPAPLMRAGYAGVMIHKDASWLNMYKG